MREYYLENETLKSRHIPEDHQINRQVVRKIRERYTPDDEAKLQRLAVDAITAREHVSQVYIDYTAYVERCRTWGDEQKAAAQKLQNKWGEYQPAADETVAEHRKRLEAAEML